MQTAEFAEAACFALSPCLPAELFVIQLILDTLLGIVTIIYPCFVVSVCCGVGYNGNNGHWCWHHAMWWVARHG